MARKLEHRMVESRAVIYTVNPQTPRLRVHQRERGCLAGYLRALVLADCQEHCAQLVAYVGELFII